MCRRWLGGCTLVLLPWVAAAQTCVPATPEAAQLALQAYDRGTLHKVMRYAIRPQLSTTGRLRGPVYQGNLYQLLSTLPTQAVRTIRSSAPTHEGKVQASLQLRPYLNPKEITRWQAPGQRVHPLAAAYGLALVGETAGADLLWAEAQAVAARDGAARSYATQRGFEEIYPFVALLVLGDPRVLSLRQPAPDGTCRFEAVGALSENSFAAKEAWGAYNPPGARLLSK